MATDTAYGVVEQDDSKPFLIMHAADAESVPTEFDGEDWAQDYARQLASLGSTVQAIASRMGSYNRLIEVKG